MIIASVVVLWFGLGLLFTVALCRAAGFPTPEQAIVPPVPLEPPAAAGGSIDGGPASNPPAENACEDPSVNPGRMERGSSLTVLWGLSGHLCSARMTSPQPQPRDAHRRRRELDEQQAAVELAQGWVTG